MSPTVFVHLSQRIVEKSNSLSSTKSVSGKIYKNILQILSQNFWPIPLNNILAVFNRTTIKIFQAVQRNLKSLCISRNRVSFGLSELKHIFPHSLSIILLFLSIVHVAETPKQYVETISFTVEIIFLTINFLSMRYYSYTIFRLIDDLEAGINTSEYKM